LPVEDYYFKYHFTREARPEPDGPRFVDIVRGMTSALTYLEPGGLARLETNAEPGGLVAHDAITASAFVYVVDPKVEGRTPLQKLKMSAGVRGIPTLVSIAPGPISFEVENDLGQKASMSLFFKPQRVLDEAQAVVAAGGSPALVFDKFLSGRRLLTSPTFRAAFGSETIQSAEGLGVRDISILFTDLKGSTDMYDRIGDLKAFALVNQHFDRLARVIARNRGAVVKTIGDAVMASFEDPTDAVHAAREMLRDIEDFNREVGEREIVLKVGVHRGASIAVTLNERLDFFGQTVNIASRVQGLADADEIYVTEDVYRAPGVAEILDGLHVTPSQASLRGVQRAVSVYRVASAAPG
jgi:class 3 adenylate cyclase